ncbi:hypothetical protein A152_0016380 [Vibrio tasmaniensis 1F-187]|uniref:hypothetical protein n=1 Tax=unclassified Vibrio TaxID=2614977 RepID=UPI0002EA3E8A|nr:hypothetical protein [Vibrio tasmaniensis]OEF60090.1 hypothetical protein A152_09070 [Vibrio tasmaniensis 1F-187]
MNNNEDKALLSVYENRLRRLGVVDKQIKKWMKDCSPLELKKRIDLLKESQCSLLQKIKKSSADRLINQESNMDISNVPNEEATLQSFFTEKPKLKTDIQGLVECSPANTAFTFDSQPVTKIMRVKYEDVVIDDNTDITMLNKRRHFMR